MTAGRLACLRRFVADRAGTMTVEFVLVMPLFLLFLLFAFEAGRFLYSRNELSWTVQGMSRDALLAGSLDKALLTDRLAGRFTILRREALQSVEIRETVNPDRTRWVDISVSYRFAFLLPALVGSEFITLTSSDRFLRE